MKMTISDKFSNLSEFELKDTNGGVPVSVVIAAIGLFIVINDHWDSWNAQMQAGMNAYNSQYR